MFKNFFKKFEFSKILATISMLLFIFTLLFCLVFISYIILYGTATIIDMAIFTSALTITGAVFMTTAKHYYSKSGLQNTCHIRNGVYEQIMNVRLKYIQEVLKLQKEYNISEMEISELEIDSPFVDISNSFLNGTSMKLDEVQTIHESEPEGDII